MKLKTSLESEPEQIPQDSSFEYVAREIDKDPRLRKLGASIVTVLSLSVMSAGVETISQQEDDDRIQPDHYVTQLDAAEQPLSATADQADIEVGDPKTTEAPKNRSEDSSKAQTQSLEGNSGETTPIAENKQINYADIPAIDEVLDTAGKLVDIDIELPPRRMPYHVYAEHATEMIDRLPDLKTLGAYFPENPMTRNIEAQKIYINYLDHEVEPTLEGFRNFQIDTSRNDAFRETGDYHEHIDPKLFIIHWTGMGYDNVDHFIKSLKPYRVQYFIDRQARTYELFESDHNKPAHALRANDFSQGVEIETGDYDGEISPLFNYKPEQIEHAIYIAVDFLRRNNLPVNETTIISHQASDLLFANPYYNPHSGKFRKLSLRKYDPPEELMGVIVNKAKALDESLDSNS